jgi:hypothetical protein
MSITMQHERDNLYRLELGGTLRKKDLDRCQEQLVGEIGRIGPIRLLFVLQEFEGWERGSNWNDLSFYVGYGDQIERIAIVGPERTCGGRLWSSSTRTPSRPHVRGCRHNRIIMRAAG